MANSPASIGNPSNSAVTEDASPLSLTATGIIPISDADAGQAAFKTTVKSTSGNLGALVIAANGTYTYSVANSAVQYLGLGKTKVDTFTVTSIDGTTKVISFTINGTNDAAVIGDPVAHDVTEDVAVSGGNLKATGTLSISDVDQGEASFQTTVTSVGSNLGTLTIASNGTYTYSVSNSATQYLGANDVRTEIFTVKALDGTTKQISFTIHGSNDLAVIGTPTVTKTTDTGGPSLTASGTISITDADQGQAAFKTTVTSVGANLGTLTLNANGSYTYSVDKAAVGYLGVGATKTETFAITSADGGTTKQVSFVVTGINDAAVIGNPTVHDVTEDATQPVLYAFGNISIADPDAGEASFQTALLSGNGALGTLLILPNGAYTYYVADSAVQYLGAGDSKVDKFIITSKDGTTKEVSFTIHGTNDAAVIGTPTNRDVTVDPNAATLTATGSISITDVDQNQSTFKTTVISAAGNFGNLTLNSNGTYTYTVQESVAEQLAIGASKTDTFTVTAFDGTTKQVTFVVHGPTSANHAAVIGNPTVSSVTEDVAINGSGNLTAAGTISISDADAGQATFQTTVTSAAGNLGNLSLQSDGHYTYAVANSLTQSLGAGSTKIDTFTITSADGTQKQVTFTINGANDAATIGTPAIVDVTEDDNSANLRLTGTLSISDVDQGQNSFQTTVTPVGTTLGSLTLFANGDYSYAVANSATQSLGAGASKTDTFTIKSFDGTPQQVSFTIHGVNDAAVIGNPVIHDVTEDVALSGANLTASGTLAISDLDAGEASFQTTVTPVGTNLGTLTIASNGDYTYSVANSATQSMGANDTKTETFTVTSLDGTPKQISFIIHGTNDTAVIGTPIVTDVTEDVGVVNNNLTLSGTLAIADTDTGQNSFQTTVISAGGNFGSLTIGTNGAYTYTVANSATQSLGPNATHVDTFTIKSFDGTSQQISFNIHGAQDAPTLSVTTANGFEDTGVPLLISSGLVDGGANLTLTIAGVPAGASLNHGTVDGNGVWHLTGGDLSGLTLSAGTDVSGTFNLSVTATSTDITSNAQLTTAPQTLTVNVVGVADTPMLSRDFATIDVPASTGAIPLHLHFALADPSETGTIKIGGVTGNYELSAGTKDDDGNWIITAGPNDNLSQIISDLSMKPVAGAPLGDAGEFDLVIEATSADGASVAKSTTNVTVTVEPAPGTVNSQVVDGYISGATVFSDDDGDGVQDVGEAFTTTRADGTFTLIGAGGGKLVMYGGIDVSTGLAFHGSLTAVAGSSVITPLTTLVAALAVSSDPVDVKAAQDAVLSALGIQAGANFDLQSYDPVQAAATGDALATSILSAGIQVQTTIAQISAATAGAGTTGAAVVSAVANTMASGNAVDLTQATTLSTIVGGVVPAGTDSGIVDTVASVVAAANTAIAEATSAANTGGDTFTALTNLAQAATVALGQTTAALSGAGLNATALDTVHENNTGEALNNAIDHAEVGDPDGSQVGTLGNDTIAGAGGNDVIDGLDGNDTLSGLGGKDTIHGGNGNDKIFGGDGDDKLYGDDGKDVITGGAGDDLIDGGNSFDRASYAEATGGLTINLGTNQPTHTVTGNGVGTDTLVSIEGVIGSDYADIFNAGGFAEVSGVPGVSIGQNEFEGKGGDDIINGTINAQGQKLTRANYLSATGSVTVDLAAGTADGDASVGHDQLTNVSVVWGSASNDIFRGSDNPFGTYEVYEGRGGDDFIDGRGGYDQVSYFNDPATASGIVVRLAAGTVTGDATVGTDTLRAVEAVRGTAFDDIFDASNFGNAGTANIGSSGTFNDFGGAGGNDTIIGNGATRLNYALALASVTVNLETSVPGTTTAITVAGSAYGTTEGTDTFTGVNAVQGSVFGDTLTGSSFNNNFTGLGGDDIIDGRGGFDTAIYNSMGLATGGVTVNLAVGTATGDASIGTDTLRSIEGIQGTNYADTFNAVGYGNGQAGTLNIGNNGTFNQFEGLGGNDTITGNGNTRIAYFNAAAGVTVTFTGSGSGTASGTAAGDIAYVGTDTFTGVNSVTGSAWNDIITADGNSNTLTGGGGNDTIDGGGSGDIAIFSGTRAQYNISINGGQVTVTDTVAGRDGTDTLTNIEVLQFTNVNVLVASGTQANPIDLSDTRLFFNAAANPLTSLSTSSANDYVKISGTLSGHLIDLGAGTDDTVTLGVTGGYSLNLANVENLKGTAGNDFVGMLTNVNGLSIDLGADNPSTGSDTVNLFNGSNTVSVVNVENLNGSDFNANPASNDTLTISNNVSGLSVNLAQGNNTLNLAAGTNSFVNIFNVQHINGTASDDTLSISNGFSELGNNPIIDLGAGDNTVNLGAGGGSFTLLNVQHFNGSSQDNFFTFNNNVNGIAVDLGGGTNDNLTLAIGSNSLSLSNVENVSSADWTGAASNDTLTLLNNVTGVSLTLQQGYNKLYLKAGANEFTNLWSVDEVHGTSSDDTLTVTNSLYTPNNDNLVDLGGGDDTLSIGGQYVSLSLLNTEHLIGNSLDNYFTLTSAVTGLAVDLGAGNDGLQIAGGMNSLSLTSVESINTGDNFGAGIDSNDTLTLLNNVSGLTVNLQAGTNTLNLAAGTNSVTTYNVQTINGTTSDDTLTMLNDAGGDTIDLGAGNDTLSLSVFTGGVTVKNVESVIGSSDTDFITVGASANPTTVTAGGGTDFITLTAGAGQDTIRYTSASQSAVGAGDVVANFDASSDTIQLDHVATGQVHFVSNFGAAGSGHPEARLNFNVVQIDLDGDGQIGAGDMEISLNNLSGTLSDANFVTTGVNHAPTDISLVGSTVAENSPNGTVVGTLSSFDPDAGDTATFAVVGGVFGSFAVNGNNLVVSGPLDFETAPSQQVTVRVTDAGGLSYDKLFNISVTDVNEAPSVAPNPIGNVAENAPVSTIVYHATASDPDTTAPNNTITWSLSGADAAAFNIDSNGDVRLNSSANFEAKAMYNFSVVATDGGNLSGSWPVMVMVGDVNEAPTVTSGASGSVAENAAASTVVYQAVGTDPDLVNTISWSLAGTDAAAFSIDANGQVRLNNSANYEAKSSYSIDVVATDGGMLSGSKAVTINVTDVNEAPTVTSLGTASIAENAPTNTVVYQATASDPDTSAPNSTITWSLSGTDAATFSIDSAGHVTLNSSANYEAKNSYNINVVATDGGSLSSTKAVSVSVTDVNEAPTNISVSNANVQQSTANGSIIGALSSTDPDAGDTATYSLVDGAGGQFDVVNGNIVVAGALTAGSQQVIVRATDALGLTFDKTISINVYGGSTVVGTTGADPALNGTSGDDLIQGLAGNDRLQGFAGNDTLDGGQAFDRAIYTDATGPITASLAAGTVSGAGVGSDTLINIEGIVGSAFDDNISAAGFTGDTGVAGTNVGFNEIEGGLGNDTITSGINSQGAFLTRISYANASGSVTVDLNAHTATGADGNDTLVGNGFAGIVGSSAADQLLGSANGAGTVEVFEGRGGNDTLNGRGGFDRADYALDSTTTSGITVNMFAGTVTGDTTVGNDTLISIESVRGTNFADSYTATGFTGSGANPGSNGTFNEFIGMGGNDTITGNFNTRVSFTNATGAVQVDLQTDSTVGTLGATTGKGIATGDTSTGTDTFTGVNAVMGSMFSDTIYGSNATNVNETFTGLGGDDFINGRGGFDIISYNNIYFSTGPVTIDFTAGTASGDASIGHDTFRGIEAAQGTNFNDVFVATNFGATNFLNGANFNVGNNGNFNQFEGLLGDDTITGNGNTRIIYSSATTAGVTINLQAGTASGANVGNDTYVGVNSATGTNFDDVYNAAGFTGVTSAGSFGTFNLFEGLLGNDIITGNGNTRVSYSQSGTAVTVTLAGAAGSDQGSATGTSIGTDRIVSGVNSVAGSNSADTLTGSGNDEFFFGGGGDDQINAGGGNDGITGQGGNDTIDGGAGTDMVSFTGAQSQYSITATQVQDNTANRDGTDGISNIEVLQFSDAIVLLTSGTAGSPVDLSTQQQLIGNGSTLIGTSGDDYLRVGSNIFGHQINLGAGASDTVLLSSSFFGNGYTLYLVGVEFLTGSNSDEFVNLTANANGLVVDLGGGSNDSLSLAAGANTLSVTGVENMGATDYGATPGVDDVLTFQNQVSGINISLGNGNNTMNLAAGVNSFTNIFDVNHVNGTTGDDTLTVTGAISAAHGTTIDLGAGDDTLVVAGNFSSFAAVGIEHIVGSASENSVNLTNNVFGIDINLGAGIADGVSLASGTNSLSITGVENLSTSDFGGLNPSNDVITLLNTVSGVTVNMGDGTGNVLNIAAGSSSFANLYNVNQLNGSASDDTLTLLGSGANVIDMGDGNDTVNFHQNVFDITVTNAENINGSANFDRITIGTNTAGNTTTITAGMGADEIYASSGHDNFRFTGTADSAESAGDTIHNFDAANDSFTFSGINFSGGPIEYVDSAAFTGGGHASAHLDDFGGGHAELHIDTNGDGTSDMQISLQNFSGTLHNSNFLLAP